MQDVKYASFFRRLAANCIDGLILMVIGVAISLSLGRNPFEATAKTTGAIYLAVADYSITLIVSTLYILIFWLKYNGQTPGKRAMHIKIIKEDGSPLDWGVAIIRYIGYFVSWIPLCLGYLWAIWDSRKQAWHDKIARTLVVESDEQEPSKFIYACGCLLPVLFMIICFAVGFFAGLSKINNPTNVALQKTKTAMEEMKPEAKQHWDRSQELFRQMQDLQSKEGANTVEQIKKLNDENISELKSAIEVEPDNARIWVELGHAYTWISTKGTLDDSTLAYKKASELEPDNVVYNNYYGDALIAQGKYEEAVLVFQKSLRLTNESGYAYKSLGTAYENLKIYDTARENYQKALEIFQKTNQDGQWDQEILDLQKAIARLPKT
jgi:uncharacterized RDD family membrane protein YckC